MSVLRAGAAPRAGGPLGRVVRYRIVTSGSCGPVGSGAGTIAMREVLVAVDESDASARVREFVNGFFGGLDVSITVVNVGTAPVAWGPYVTAPGGIGPWGYAATMPATGVATAEIPVADQARESAEDTVESSGVRAGDHVVTLGGDVAEKLRRVAAEREVDLLVVGSNHRGIFDRLLSPSVSTGLAKRAPCPVLVVH